MKLQEPQRRLGAVRTAWVASSCILIALSVLVPAFSGGMEKEPNASGAGDEAYVGIWKAEYQGKTFALLKLKIENQKLNGTLSSGEINVDKDGEVNEVTEEANSETPISEIKRDGAALSFKVQNENDVDQYQLNLTGEDSAELKIVSPGPLPEGVPVIKPFKMRKQSAKP